MGLEIIQELKKKKGLTTEMLSKLSGIPVGTLNKILNGETKDPKLETLKAIARVLECTLDDFDDEERQTDKTKIKPLLTEKEKMILEKYRYIDDYGKKAVDAILNVEHERCREESENTIELTEEEIERLKIEKYINGGSALLVARKKK